MNQIYIIFYWRIDFYALEVILQAGGFTGRDEWSPEIYNYLISQGFTASEELFGHSIYDADAIGTELVYRKGKLVKSYPEYDEELYSKIKSSN